MAQFLRPSSDISTTNWTGTFADIDEASASDSDFGWSANKTTVTYETKLSTGTDPLSSINHIIRCRVADNISGAPSQGGSTIIAVSIYLYQGATLIQTLVTGLNVSLWADLLYTLTELNADNITDYSDLRLRFVTNSINKYGIAISWAEMEIPNVSAVQKRIFNIN